MFNNNQSIQLNKKVDQRMNLNKIIYNVFNYAGAAAGWWACILGAAAGNPWLGPVVVSAYLGFHLSWSKQKQHDAIFILLAGLVGLGVETIKKITGLIIYQADIPGGLLPPFWMLAMWLLFASTLTASLGWLRGRYLLSFALGAVFGPLSYLAGEGLGAISLPHPPLISITALSIIWALALPTLAWMAGQLLPKKERILN